MRCVGKANIPALGMTETLGVYAWGRDLATPEYPIAAPLDELQPGFELLLADDDGNEVVDGVRAQILLRGPTVAGLCRRLRAEMRSTPMASIALATWVFASARGCSSRAAPTT